MRNRKPLIYWDSCIFISWLKDEKLDPAIMDGISEVVKEADEGRLNLLTSVVTRTEVLESTLTPDQSKIFNRIFFRPQYLMANLDRRIADLSHEIRDFYYKHHKNDIDTPDCHHLATAIIYEAQEFQTLDGMGKKKAGKLIPLSGTIAGKYPLRICTPFAAQPSFTFTPRELEVVNPLVLSSAKLTTAAANAPRLLNEKAE